MVAVGYVLQLLRGGLVQPATAVLQAPPWAVVEQVDGVSLSKLLRGLVQPLPLPSNFALALTVTLTLALTLAHVLAPILTLILSLAVALTLASLMPPPPPPPPPPLYFRRHRR